MAEEGLRVAPRAGAPRVVYGMALAGRGRVREALHHLRMAQDLFGDEGQERVRIDAMIAALRARAPDSLRTLFEADSVQARAKQAARDSLSARGRRAR